MGMKQCYGGLLAVLLLSAGIGEAQANWAAHHPRRAEVNHRLANQNRRINAKLTNKQMTYQEGSKLKREDRHIRREERGMAAEHGGHITRGEQRSLNRQEDHVSRQISP